ncbi:MAG: type II secretion system GspH family protein [Phycisphaerae bacterium]|nr:type II secretion system GspH family protein [Phycisphaerae bacterium]
MAKEMSVENNHLRFRGFTLIEMLATFVLVILIIPAVMKGLSIATMVSSDSVNKSDAISLAENKLSEVLLEEEWQNSSQSGDFGEMYPDYEWTMTSADWTEPSLKQVTVKVLWYWRGREKDVSISTLVYVENEQTE